jgi:N utilization substance protein B
MGSRRKAREYALQMLFQWDITHDSIEQIKSTFWEGQDEPEETREFAEKLASGSIEHVEEIDVLIQRHAENWRLDRMAVVDRNILRVATYEFLYDAETAKTIVINEAIEVARRFSAQESPQFINGILDSIRKEVESLGAQ